MVAVAAYCVVGVVYNYRVKERRGSELIPNLFFWTELPVLVKVLPTGVQTILHDDLSKLFLSPVYRMGVVSLLVPVPPGTVPAAISNCNLFSWKATHLKK